MIKLISKNKGAAKMNNIQKAVQMKYESAMQEKERILTNALDYFMVRTEEIGDRVSMVRHSEGENILIDGNIVISFKEPEVKIENNVLKFALKYKEYYKKGVL